MPPAAAYTLSGDLGGFVIDPSSSTVAVKFLDENRVYVGHRNPAAGHRVGSHVLDRVHPPLRHWRDPGGHPQRAGRGDLRDQNPVLGNYNNAYADNLSFTVNDPTSPLDPAPPESNVGQLDHVFMVYLENKGVGQIVGSPNAPYIKSSSPTMDTRPTTTG